MFFGALLVVLSLHNMNIERMITSAIAMAQTTAIIMAMITMLKPPDVVSSVLENIVVSMEEGTHLVSSIEVIET